MLAEKNIQDVLKKTFHITILFLHLIRLKKK